MGDDFSILNILLFALIAGFLVLRLRNVLGRRDGHQGPSVHPLPTPGQPETRPEAAAPPTRRGESGEAEQPADGEEQPAEPEPRAALQAGLKQIAVADPNFRSAEFTSGARIAFEMIVSAFASGESNQLKRMLSPEVFSNFAQTIREREKAGQKQQTTVVSIKSSDIVEAYMAGRTAHVTVKFVSEQISCLRDAKDDVIDGHPTAVNEVADFWTFARDTRSTDPNWTLVATGSLD
jgi:predicted lipid-binding transport protein (Tim44 family)